jgi:integrase
MTPGLSVAPIEMKYYFEDSDRHGNPRRYFRQRIKGSGKIRKVRLREMPGTPEFHQEFAAALAGRPYAKEVVKRPEPPKAMTNSLRWLVEEYYRRSSTFRGYDDETKKVRRNILKALCNEPVTEGSPNQVGDLPFEIPKDKIIVLRDRKAIVSIDAANARLKALRQVYNWAMTTEPKLIAHNIANDIGLLTRIDTGGHHTWSIEEILRFVEVHPAGTKAYLALWLFLLSGQRLSDVAKLGKQHIRKPEHIGPKLREIHAGRWLAFRQHKNRRRHPVDLVIPILPQLEEVIALSPCGALTFLETEHKQPHSTKGLGNWFGDMCRNAGVPGRAHGLRKAGATIAAENGATPHQLMAIFGWKTLEQAEVYTRKVRQQRVAGASMGLLSFGLGAK